MVELRNVSKLFGHHLALDCISATIPEGQIVGLLGQNGAGKTTLLRILTGILRPDSGHVIFNNKPLIEEELATIGYLPEERGLYRKMKVIDLLVYLGRLKGLSSSNVLLRANELLIRFELDAWAKEEVGSLSKGMQQKIQFITAIIHEPRLLILDEPFSGFDPVNAAILKKEILALKNNGVTVILSTHRLDSAEELCSYFLMLNNSKLVLDSSKENIIKSFNTNLISILTESEINFVPKSFEIVKTNGLDYTVKIKVNCLKNEVLLELIQNNCNILSFNKVRSTMEDIFISKTTG